MSAVSLQDFQPLNPAEASIIAGLSRGAFDRIGDGRRPESPEPDRIVRAEFLRFLLLGGEEGFRPHEKGVQISGAWITGPLDLEGCRIPMVLALRHCALASTPVLSAAIIDSVQFDSSSLPGLLADGLELRGGLSLVAAHVTGAIIMPGCRLGANLRCDGATLICPNKTVLDADALVARSVLLRGANIEGGISLFGARLGMDFNASASKLTHPEEVVINAEGIEVKGSVHLRSCDVQGEVRMTGAHITGDLDLTGTNLFNPGRDALQVKRTLIEGGFFLRDEAAVTGTVDLTGATVGAFHDELACWPGSGDILLNRCLYSAFMGGSVDAESRLEWLSRQSPERWDQDFWPQPYEQLANVFLNMGHDEDSRAVLIAKEQLQRQARRERAKNPVFRGILWLMDATLGITLRYGRQPLVALVWLMFFWAVGVGVFGFAESRNAFKPASTVVLRSPEWTMCSIEATQERFLSANQQFVRGRAAPGQSQLECFREQQEAISYPRFNVWMYSLDTLFQLMELDQKSFWRPDQNKEWGGLAITYFYFQTIVGWVLSLLAVAGFSGLVKSRSNS
ncbi:MAG: hypothetical protein ING72_09630 [Methylobacterium sp.]|nr:hypothetical protein [Methylobacterium sp.]